MRKFFFKKAVLAFLSSILFLPIFLTGCGQVDFSSHAHTYISEYRKNLFINRTGSLLVTFTSGERESDYDLTGFKTPLIEFGVLTVKFNMEIGEILPSFELTVDDKSFAGQLEKNPFDGSYVFDIESKVDDEAVVTLKLIDFEQNLKLVCISKDWKSTWEDAVEVFNQKFNKEVLLHTKDGKFLGEIYVKIVSDNKDLNNIYWYVLCVCQDGSIFSCLINPNTLEIVQNSSN